MLEWMFWEQYSHEPYVAVRIARLYYLKSRAEELDPALMTKGNAALARLELQLKQTPYLVGDALTLADIALLAYTRKAHMGGFDMSQFPAVRAWIKGVEQELGREPAAAKPLQSRWCHGRGLNSRPHPYQGCALPLSYRGHARKPSRPGPALLASAPKRWKPRGTHGRSNPVLLSSSAMSKKQPPKQDARRQRLAAALKRNITRRKAAQPVKTEKK